MILKKALKICNFTVFVRLIIDLIWTVTAPLFVLFRFTWKMIFFPADYEPMSNVIILRSIVQYCTGDFLAAAAVVVFVVVVNNNEEISYQGHNQIHIHSRLCYIFFSSCCLVLFFAPSFSLQLFQWDTVFWKIISSITC